MAEPLKKWEPDFSPAERAHLRLLQARVQPMIEKALQGRSWITIRAEDLKSVKDLCVALGHPMPFPMMVGARLWTLGPIPAEILQVVSRYQVR